MQPLTKLLHKEAGIDCGWGPDQEQAIQQVKNRFLSPQMLAHFNPNIKICLQTDTSDFALATVLCHLVQQDGKLKVIYYASKTLDRAQANYLVTEKECLAAYGPQTCSTHFC